MNNKLKIALVVVALVGVGGLAWVTSGGQFPMMATAVQPSGAPDALVLTSQGKKVTEVTPVQATQGKVLSLAIANHGDSELQVTIPGLHDDPMPVAAGGNTNLDFAPGTSGTYPIIEHGTMPNTRSIEGGTSGYEMEVGKVEVAGSK